jgi:hypothetical protein
MKRNGNAASTRGGTDKGMRFGAFLRTDLAQSFYAGSGSVLLDCDEVLRALRKFLFYAAAARNDDERAQVSLIADLVGKHIRKPLAKVQASGKLDTKHGDEQIHVIAVALYRAGTKGAFSPGCAFRKRLVQLCFNQEFSQVFSFGGRSVA